MTLRDAAGATAARTSPRIDDDRPRLPPHPALGETYRAHLEPLSPTLHRIELGGRVVGYLESAGPVWVALAGEVYAFAVEVAQHRELTVALRAVTNPHGVGDVEVPPLRQRPEDVTTQPIDMRDELGFLAL